MQREVQEPLQDTTSDRGMKSKETFVQAANQLIENKEDVPDSNIVLLKERLTDTEVLWKRSGTCVSTLDLNLLADKVQQLIAENARVAQNQDDYRPEVQRAGQPV
jgi:site-specific DNA recombinase